MDPAVGGVGLSRFPLLDVGVRFSGADQEGGGEQLCLQRDRQSVEHIASAAVADRVDLGAGCEIFARLKGDRAHAGVVVFVVDAEDVEALLDAAELCGALHLPGCGVL